jgi:hypothetical protein
MLLISFVLPGFQGDYRENGSEQTQIENRVRDAKPLCCSGYLQAQTRTHCFSTKSIFYEPVISFFCGCVAFCLYNLFNMSFI